MAGLTYGRCVVLLAALLAPPLGCTDPEPIAGVWINDDAPMDVLRLGSDRRGTYTSSMVPVVLDVEAFVDALDAYWIEATLVPDAGASKPIVLCSSCRIAGEHMQCAEAPHAVRNTETGVTEAFGRRCKFTRLAADASLPVVDGGDGGWPGDGG
ncbi:MAG: hypothetical protein HY744_05105 [Deltaproteobacteria bacterium]|nr:hypothetical protein [Deltaproteobacteria bacterium]